MPNYFKFSDPGYFEAIASPSMRVSGAVTREVMPGWNLGAILMGDDEADPNTPVASMLWIAPGDTLPRHAHDCFRVEVIVVGSIDVPGGVMLHPGDVMTSRPGEYYGPHIAGPEGCLSVEIFSTAKGTSPITDPAEGLDEDSVAVARRVNEVIARMQAEAAAAPGPA
jgi:hypothetical protein